MRSGFSLGGKHVFASVMFADIRSFTTIAESQDPAETIDMLNSYFALMFDAISNNHGAVNQVIGDGLVAVFGAPMFFEEHREHAVRAAVEMLDQLKVFNQQQALHKRPRIQIGIGIASGQMIAGYTGTLDRAIYTCIGDTVNLASRIEDHTKVALRPLLIDNYTREGLSGSYQLEDLGPALFKGKQQPINIFAVSK